MKIPFRPLTVALMAVAVSAAAAGCSSDSESPNAEATAPALPGTTWQLVSLQSADDAQGTTPVPDPAKFTVTFDQNGTDAFFQLDCNRGKGTYTLEPGADGSEGKLKFGPIATTMMMCPQPSLDSQVGKALSNVRTYLIKDDQLHLSQLADAGVLTWKRG